MVTTIAEILPESARTHGDRVALIIDSRRMSFRELDALSNRVANGLVASGVQPGDRVSLFGPNCWEWIVSYYGILKAGAVVNPLSSMLTHDEAQYAVTDAGASALMASPDKAQILQGVKAGGGRFKLVLWNDAPVAEATLLRKWLTDASYYTTRRRRPRRFGPTGGCTPATSPPSTTTATRRSSIGRQT